MRLWQSWEALRGNQEGKRAGYALVFFSSMCAMCAGSNMEAGTSDETFSRCTFVIAWDSGKNGRNVFNLK